MIAVIDDGINTAHLNNISLKHDLSVEKNGTIRKRNSIDEPIITNHGTTCVAIICKYSLATEFSSLRIFSDESLKADCNMLVSALIWCRDNKIPIVHMSVGSTNLNDYHEIRQVIAEMISNRQIVISAHSNRNLYTMPACIGGVLGVATDENMVDDEYAFVELGNDNFHFIKASSLHEIADPYGYKYVTPLSNSCAAPTITAYVHNILSKHKPFSLNIAQIYTLLGAKSGFSSFVKPDFIHNAYVINPHGYSVSERHFFFKCIRQYQSVEEYIALSQLNDKEHGTHSIVFLANKSDYGSCEKELLCLLPLQKSVESLLFAGKLPVMSDFCKSYFDDELIMWSEENIAYGGDISPKLEHCSCPIIYVYGRGIKVLELICELRNMFTKDEYQCVGVCDHRFSYLYGLEYIPDNAHKEDLVLRRIDEIYEPDIIIFCSENSKLPSDPHPEDFYIVWNEEFAGDTPFELNKNIMKITDQFTDVKDFIDIYNVLLESLS